MVEVYFADTLRGREETFLEGGNYECSFGRIARGDVDGAVAAGEEVGGF